MQKKRNRARYVKIMEERLGRPLNPGEIIHHTDGDCSNDDPSNLMLCKNRSEHGMHHTLINERAGWPLRARIGKKDAHIQKVKQEHYNLTQERVNEALARLNYTTPTQAVCTMCEVELPASEFKTRIGKGGCLKLDNLCRGCRKEMNKANRLAKKMEQVNASC